MEDGSGFHFLFQTDRGRIGPEVWRRGTIPLVLVAGLATFGWSLLKPHAFHDLGTTPFLDPATIFAFVYLAVFAFGLILIAVCEYNLSAKRFRDRGRPPALAAVLPLALLLSGATIWFIPRSFGEVPDWAGPAAMVAVVLIAAWNIAELGFGEGRSG